MLLGCPSPRQPEQSNERRADDANPGAHAAAGAVSVTRVPPSVPAQVRADLERVLATRERPDEEHARLRAALDAVPGGRRGRSWREASVLVDLAFRKRPGRSRTQLRRMRARRGEAFAELWAECARVLAPYTLGPHGYDVALGTREPAVVWGEVAGVLDALAGLGHEAFVVSGTLLGLVRDGGLVPHDDDVDLAVLLASSEVADLAEEWLALKEQLGRAGLLDPDFEHAGKNHCKLAVASGLGVDLFPAWLVGDRVFVWPHTHGELGRDDLLPLERREVAGATVSLPRRPEPMLELNYGAGWRTPDPTYRFDWTGAKQRFADFVALLPGTHEGSGWSG